MNHREPPIDCNPLNSTAPIAQPAPTKPAAWFSAARSRPAPCRKGAGAAPLPLPLNAELRFAGGSGPRIALYLALPDDSMDARRLTPLVVVHSVNAAASAAEIRPVFERLRATRPVLALELPGFGMSQRGPLEYTPQAMATAILRAVDYLRQEGFARPVSSVQRCDGSRTNAPTMLKRLPGERAQRRAGRIASDIRCA